VLALIGGGIVASQQGKAKPKDIPTINNDTPTQVKDPLSGLVGTVNAQ
jgi:hypothetical protein